MITDCTDCSGTGWVVTKSYTIPCTHCNCRGKISDQLYEDDLKNWMHGKRKTPSLSNSD